MKVIRSNYLPPDKWALLRAGEVVCVVNRGAPIEDAIFDAVMMPPADFDILSRLTSRP